MAEENNEEYAIIADNVAVDKRLATPTESESM